MHRKRFYKRSTRKARIIENIVSYSIVFIIAIILSVLLITLSKPNNIIIKNIKPSIQKSKSTIEKAQPNNIIKKSIKPNIQKPKSIIKKVQPSAKIIKKTKPKKPIVIKKITRSEAFKRGMDIINYVWVYDANKNGIKFDDNVSLPNYLKGVKKVKVSGLPYCWGGYTSLDISYGTDVKNFQMSLKKGYTAGNINCIGNYKYHTAGLDCSGFVCAVFKIPEKCGTGDLSRYFNIINANNLKPMDILDCVNKHVFIYLSESSDKKGIITMEAAYNNNSLNSEKTKINYRSWDSIKKGINGKPFIAMRYKGIVNDAVKLFKDRNEYNFDKENATLIKINQQYKGYIDYADDKDYFDLNVDKDSKYMLRILKLPEFCSLVIVNSNGKAFLNVKKTGGYSLKLLKDIYYIKVSSVDFKFDSNKYYLFKLQDSFKNKEFRIKSSNSQKNKVNKTVNKIIKKTDKNIESNKTQDKKNLGKKLVNKKKINTKVIGKKIIVNKSDVKAKK